MSFASVSNRKNGIPQKYASFNAGNFYKGSLENFAAYWRFQNTFDVRRNSNLENVNNVSFLDGYARFNGGNFLRVTSPHLDVGNFSFTYAMMVEFTGGFGVYQSLFTKGVKATNVFEVYLDVFQSQWRFQLAPPGGSLMVLAHPSGVTNAKTVLICKHDATNDKMILDVNGIVAEMAYSSQGVADVDGEFRIGTNVGESFFVPNNTIFYWLGYWKFLTNSKQDELLRTGLRSPFT